MESRIKNWCRKIITLRISHPRKRLGISQIRRHLLRKRISTHRRTRNLSRRNPLHRTLPKSYRKSSIRSIQSLIRPKHLLWRLSIETQHGNPRIQKRRKTQHHCLRHRHQNRYCLIQNRCTRLSRCMLLIWRIIRRRSFLKLKRHEQIIRYQKTLDLNLLLRKSFIKFYRKNLVRKRWKHCCRLISLNHQSQS